jgi:hypothetical protein
MKRLALVALLSLGTAIGASSASAAPTVAGNLNGIGKADSGVQLIKKRGNRGFRNRGFRNRGFKARRYGNRGWRSGRRYGRRYSGWRRYSYRPYNYRSRGCIVLGPVWLCP